MDKNVKAGSEAAAERDNTTEDEAGTRPVTRPTVLTGNGRPKENNTTSAQTGDVSRNYASKRRKQRVPIKVVSSHLGGTLGNCNDLLIFVKLMSNCS